ncbi:MAG: hypothetical protein ACO3KY_13260 [Lysobacterales bacterium]
MSHSFIRCVSAAALLLLAFPVVAETPEPSGWSFSLDGGFAVQSEVDLDRDGGAFSNDRDFWSLGVDYRWNYRNSIGVSLGIGSTEYDFVSAPGSAAVGPWSDMDEWRVSLPSRWALGDTSTLFIIPSLRDYSEKGAAGDGDTWSLLAGVAWRRSESLTIGPGLGVFSRLEDDARVFPILLIDWKLSERWELSTGQGLAASQGPGLTLGYQLSPQWRLGLTGRFEEIQFRLDETGVAPGGVGEDSSLPLIFTAAWSPSPQVRLAAFAGMKLAGELAVYDRSGDRLQRDDYDAAGIYGVTIEFRN